MHPHQVQAGDTFVIQAAFNIQEGWYVYAPDDINAALGKIETTMLCYKSDAMTKCGNVVVPDPVEEAGHQVYMGDNVIMKQRFHVAAETNTGFYDVGGKITYQSCNGDLCLPPETKEWNVTVEVADKREVSAAEIDRQEFDFSSLKGKLVLIDCWATWCEPCIKGMPQLRELYDRYHSKGLEIIGISMDEASAYERVVKVIDRHGMVWPQHFEGKGFRENSFSKSQDVKVLPALFLLNTKGEVIYRSAHDKRLELLIRTQLGLK